jgi:hypothetical protein
MLVFIFTRSLEYSDTVNIGAVEYEDLDEAECGVQTGGLGTIPRVVNSNPQSGRLHQRIVNPS